MATREEWKDKIRAAIILGNEKGLHVEGIAFSPGYFVYHPDKSRKHFAGASKLIEYLEKYQP